MNDAVIESRNITLVETMDRVLNKGVILNGDLTISVADVDLIFVGIRVLLASVGTAEKMRCGYKRYEYDRGNVGTGEDENEDVTLPSIPSHRGRGTKKVPSIPSHRGRGTHPCTPLNRGDLFSSPLVGEGEGEGGFPEQPEEIKAVLPRLDANPEKVEQGLAKLVLALIDMLRRLMEKQAIRRMDSSDLRDDEVERLGDTFMKLENKMEELKRIFDLKDEDLNLNLGPLGDLM
ncbi:MAG: gas vesicle protein K [Nitrospirae bacterium]|nr:gas vesicle protein K [Nitrospirota bacterium]